jgi:hypothetical protein
LLLLRADPQNGLDIQAISERLYISLQETEILLDQLQGYGILEKRSSPVSYFYRPETEELRDMIDRLAVVYAKYLLPVTHLIHSKPKTRIQEFANAFLLRKD